MPYITIDPAKRLSGRMRGNFVPLTGDFIALNTPIPYSSLPRLGALRGKFVADTFSRPPYRNDMGRLGEDPAVVVDPVTEEVLETTAVETVAPAAGPFDGAMQWVKDNPLIAGGIVLAAILMLGGGRR